jgi:hypothetical protein
VSDSPTETHIESGKRSRSRRIGAFAVLPLLAIGTGAVVVWRNNGLSGLALKRQEGSAGVAEAPAEPGLVVPAAVGGNTSYAPFVPRTIPKNGESGGL